MVLTPSTMPDLGTPAPDFALPATDGATVRRDDFAGRPLLVIFMCNHCPYVIHLREHLAAACKELQDRGVGVVGISSNSVETHPADSPEKMVEEVTAVGYTFPYLYDETQEVAKAYCAACTPDFFLYDAEHRLYYRGQYDETRPDNGTPSGRDLIAAVDALLAGDAPPADQQPSMGCNVKWKPGNEPRA